MTALFASALVNAAILTVIGRRSDLSRRVDSLLAQRDRSRPRFSKLRFIALAVLFMGVVLAGGHARETVAFREPPQSRDAQIQSIIDDVPAAPPELGADILLRLVERGEITDPKLKRQLIEYAWDLAPKARFATEISTPISVVVESEPGSLTSSLPGLTTAALQSRVISQMAPIDVKWTRELFQKMKPPEADFPGCSASRFPNHGSYFKALGTTLETYSEEEIVRGEKTQLLNNALRSLTNQEDFRLSLELIRDGKFPDKDYAQLLDKWSEALSTAHFSDRQFSIVAWLFKETLREAAGERAKGPSAENLLRALRSYFVRHAGAVRCEDGSWRPSSPGPGLPVANNEEVARLSFNSTVAELGLNIPPIQPEEIDPKGLAGKANVINYLSLDPTDTMWEVMNAGKHLRFGTPEQQALNEKYRGTNNVAPALTPEQRGTPAWSAEALQYLTRLEAWTRGLNEEDRGMFVMKAEFYGGLLELAPEGKLRDTVVKSYVHFLVSSPLKRESPPEWAWWGIGRLVNSNIVSDKHQWLDEIEAAGDATISLYTRLARLALDRTPADAR
jgi:hypothetical protein